MRAKAVTIRNGGVVSGDFECVFVMERVGLKCCADVEGVVDSALAVADLTIVTVGNKGMGAAFF